MLVSVDGKYTETVSSQEDVGDVPVHDSTDQTPEPREQLLVSSVNSGQARGGYRL
jgi:hypothetical protein